MDHNAPNYDHTFQLYYNSIHYGGGGGPQELQDPQLADMGGMYFSDASAVIYPPVAYGNEGIMDDSGFYMHQQQQSWDPHAPQHHARRHGAAPPILQPHNPTATTTAPLKATAPGSFYLMGELEPRIFGYPVSALAYDSAYSAMYIASTTQTMSSTRWRSHRASMLVTHSTLDGMLYSSVAGHPEASPSTLAATYQCMYGISKTVPLPPSRQHVPSHAYRPPYGSSSVETASTLLNTNTTRGGAEIQQGHIGINSLLPLKGYVASISPSAVRIHSHGGLQLHDHDLEGMICGTIHPHSNQDIPTHISVGGIPLGDSSPNKRNKHEVHCMDIWQGLRVVSSRAFKDSYSSSQQPQPQEMGVTAMGTSQERGCVVAGCSDGYIRVLDGSLREIASIKSHSGGVSSVAVSDDGHLIATTGYGSRMASKGTSFLYAFPDPTVFIYDIRYLGRGGVPHPFAGLRGAPQFLSFLPDIDRLASNRLLVGSGQAGGGLQILTPFEAQNETSTSFLLLPLDQGEAISAIVRSEGDMAFGTTSGRVLQYRMAGYDTSSGTKSAMSSSSPTRGVFVPGSGKTSNRNNLLQSNRPATSSLTSHRKTEKLPLEMPSFLPPIPALSLDPILLQGNDPNLRNGPTDKIKALFTTYILQANPTVTFIGNTPEEAMSTFGPIGERPIVATSRRTVATRFINEATASDGDYGVTVPTSKLEVDLLARHEPVPRKYNSKMPLEVILNPNKLLHTPSLSSLCYEDGLNRRTQKKGKRGIGMVRVCSLCSIVYHRLLPRSLLQLSLTRICFCKSGGGDLQEQEVPNRYRLQLRPTYKSSGAFDPGEYNNSGLYPGWDYAPTMPNAFAPPVLLLLYFVPEVRNAILAAQCNEKLFSTRLYEKALSPELGFVFHQIECLSRYGLMYPSKPNCSESLKPRMGAFVPSNFLTALSTMPEAEQLQILDESPAAVDLPRRPEAFYRFLAYHLDKELSKNSDAKLMDSLLGIDFVSINQFITGSSPSAHSSTRALAVDLAYGNFVRGEEKSTIRFGEVLQHALCRETRLRAWSQKSKAYETIVQRKIATSLPKLLTLACSCAGRKEEDGLWVWRTDDGVGHWLPEVVEVEIEANGNIVVRELQCNMEDGTETWTVFGGKATLPESISTIVASSSSASTRKYQYRLDAVLSFVQDELGDKPASGEVGEHVGHHVLHARVPKQYKKRAMQWQQEEASKLASTTPDPAKLVLTANTDPEVFRKRAGSISSQIAAVEEEKEDSSQDWVLFNGFVVSKTHVEDAKAFHVAFKEPCLVLYRAVEDNDKQAKKPDVVCKIPLQVMNARSLAGSSSNNNKTPATFTSDTAFEEGTLLAFDAEFVSVQDEEAILTETGSKITLRETRHALARISVLECKKRTVVVDDHVLPRERVVDFLVRVPLLRSRIKEINIIVSS
jgi:WD40 repeat protein